MKTNSFHYLWVSLLMATLAMLSPQTICAAGATSEEINNAIVLEGSIPLTWKNGNTYPWIINDGKLQNGNSGVKNSTSKITLTYSSEEVTTFSFKHIFPSSSDYQHLKVLIDGNQVLDKHYTSISSTAETFEKRLPKGEHIIEFIDTIKNTSNYYYCRIYDVKVTEQPGASIADINKYIVSEESIPLEWSQDIELPWRLVDNKYLENGNYGFSKSVSKVSFKYNCTNPTTFSFKHIFPSSSDYQHLKVLIDGNQVLDKSYTSISSTAETFEKRLPKGEHIIEFIDTIKNTSNYYYCRIYDIKVTEYPNASQEDINKEIVVTGSLPIQWTNDDNYPWGITGGTLKNSNMHFPNTSTSLKGKITIDKPTKLGFSHRVGYNYGQSDHILRFYVNGEEYLINNDKTNWQNYYVVLTPGEYTVEWRYDNKTAGDNYYAQIKDIELTQEWTEVNVTPGMLGVEVLYKVNVLQDVKMLKVSGTMNASDWATIKQMSNLIALDISETQEESIADKTFNDLRRIKYVKLPDGLKTIGTSAFKNSGINTIDIPSSVTSIKNEAFYGSYLRHINIPENSNMTSIGEYAFCRCNLLKEFVMPNSVTSLGGYAFYECTALNKMVLSDGLTSLPEYCCNNCSAVKELHLPSNVKSIGSHFMYGANNVKELIFPESLRSIGENAFAGLHKVESLVFPEGLNALGRGAFHNSANIKTVELPSGVSSYNETFRGCTKIETVICRAATPPTISSDPFKSITKANVTLKVPPFAVASYKLDSYWYQFGNIIEGEPVDYWKIIGDLKLLNNRRMEGKPDIDLYYGGKLTIGGDAPMEVGKLDIYTSEGNPSSLVSDCNAFTADEINTIFKVDANKWYYITPMVDIDLRQVNVSGTANYVFRYYDGATRADIGAGTSWKNVSDMTLKAGVGYIFQCNAASDITFPVAADLRSKILSTNAVALPLVAHPSDNAANKGWNYVGNPYPSYYDIYYMDFTAPITVWTGSTYRAYSIADDNYVLRPMQGFFVQKPDAVDAITLQLEGRQINSTVNRSSSAKVKSGASTNNVRAIFNLEIGREKTEDVTRVVLNDNADFGYEIERDASKFMSLDDAVAQIYSIDNDDNKLAINERPANDGIVNLGIYIPDSNEEYVISASRMDGEAILIDKENDVEHILTNGGYKFTAMNNGLCEGRFALKLKFGITSGINNLSASKIVVETEAYGIIVKGAENVIVYGTDGIKLYNTATVNGDVHIELTKGVYIVVADGKSYKVAVK